MERWPLFLWVSAILLGLGAPKVSHAEQSSTGAASLDRAIAAYEELRIEEALSLLEQAERADGLDEGQQTRLALYRGLGRASLGQAEAARSSFRHALELDIEIQLPPDTSPVVVEQFEELRGQVRAAAGAQGDPDDSPPPDPDDHPLVVPPTTAPVTPLPPRRRLLSWVFLGLSGAAIIGGATTLVLALVTRSQAQGEAHTQSEADDMLETYRLETRLTIGLLSAGVALGVATLVAFLGERPLREAASGATVSLTPSPGGLLFSGTF